jgi:hypothetical protein
MISFSQYNLITHRFHESNRSAYSYDLRDIGYMQMKERTKSVQTTPMCIVQQVFQGLY